MNLQEINKSLSDSKALEQFEDKHLWISPHNGFDNLKKLPQYLQEEIEQFLNRLAEYIPDDFTYDLMLEGESVLFSLGYEDGPNSCLFDKSITFEKEDELTSFLQSKDWDEERGRILNMTNLFDEVVRLGKSLPVRIPSVKSLRKWAKDDVREYHKKKRKEKPKFTVLMAEEDSSYEETYQLISHDDFQSINDVKRFLTDAMTFRHFIVSICINGRPLPAQEIESLKAEVLDGLGPISRSKAEGRYQAVFDQLSMEDL